MRHLLILLLILLFFCARAPAGGLVIAGGHVSDISIYQKFIQVSSSETKKSPRVAVVLTASRTNSLDEEFWRKVGAKSVVAIGPNDIFPTNVDAVWFMGGDQADLEEAYVGKKFERDLLQFYRKGGTVGGNSAGCAIMSRVMIRGGSAGVPIIGTGFDLLPNSVLDQHFSQRGRLSRLEKVLKLHPNLMGVGVDENTAIIYNGEKITVLGKNTVTVLSGGSTKVLKKGESFDYRPRETAQQTNSKVQGN